jgi:hypothetical protein
VAVVVRPETLDENLPRKFLVLSTQVDNDPFVDFAYGFITGDSPAAATALAQAGKRAEGRPKQPEMAMLGVAGGGLAESTSTTQLLPLRKGSLKQTAHIIAASEDSSTTNGDKLHPPAEDAFIRAAMPKLAGNAIVLFAGHGYPRQLVGGPTYEHLADEQFDGAVVMNIACYTGVTHRWFDDDWGSGTTREKSVPAEQSFCLNMLNTGVGGYFAYVCARPAGPGMFGDAITLATEGQSTGELMRNNLNSVVLAHLQLGNNALQTASRSDNLPISRDRKVQDVLTAMSTGGVLFGDPAYVPFKRRPGAHPVQVAVRRSGKALHASVDVAGPLYHFFCSDQITMWDEGKPSLRIEARVPLGKLHAHDVKLASSTLNVPYRLTAATEDHRGRRFLHVKASFEQPAMERMMQLAGNGVSSTFEVETSSEPSSATVFRREVAQ